MHTSPRRPALLVALAVLLSVAPIAAHAATVSPLAGRPLATGEASGSGLFRPRVIPAGLTRQDLLSAYDVPPLGDGAGVTIATMQFAGWEPSDLQTYATAAGLGYPDLVEIETLDGHKRPDDQVPDLEGQFEVALDQQTILATAPAAAQRIYFAGNNDAAAIDGYSRLAADAEAGLVDVVSLTWGICELDLGTETRTAIDASLARVVAAGRTVFAASGDVGAHGCVDSDNAAELSADYPASSEHVVGVGGTTLTQPSGWSEVAWHQSVFASGGGFSAFTARPDWQPTTTVDDPAATPKMRMVPDISAVADQHTGLGVFVESAGGWNLGGGTSLASTVVAGHFAAALSAAGRTNGLGAPLHPLLYADPGTLRDVTSGDNDGYSARVGYDLVTGLGSPLWNRVLSLVTGAPIVGAPSLTASTTIALTITVPADRTFATYQICENALELTCPEATPHVALPEQPSLVVGGGDRLVRAVVVGWDLTGAPHPGVAYTRLDTSAPTASATAAFTSPTRTTANFGWGGTDPAGGSGVAHYHAVVTKSGVSTPVLDYTGLLRSTTLTLAQGGVYTLTVRSQDRAGNLSSPATALLTVPYDQTALTRSTGWGTATNSNNFLGSTWYAATRGRTLTRSVYGDSVDLLVTTGPSGGYVNIYVNNVYLRRISTYSSTRVYRKAFRIATWTGNGTRSVRLYVGGTRVAASTGTGVYVDALRVSRR